LVTTNDVSLSRETSEASLSPQEWISLWRGETVGQISEKSVPVYSYGGEHPVNAWIETYESQRKMLGSMWAFSSSECHSKRCFIGCLGINSNRWVHLGAPATLSLVPEGKKRTAANSPVEQRRSRHLKQTVQMDTEGGEDIAVSRGARRFPCRRFPYRRSGDAGSSQNVGHGAVVRSQRQQQMFATDPGMPETTSRHECQPHGALESGIVATEHDHPRSF
jgi:hypothetical protein